MDEGVWSRRNAYTRLPPVWWLVVDRNGDVFEDLRRSRVRTVTDVPGWGCLVVIFRGVRSGVVAVTDDGVLRALTPEDDEASWTLDSRVSDGRCTLDRTSLDGTRWTATWSAADGLQWDEAEPTIGPQASGDVRRVSWATSAGELEGLLATPAGDGPFPLVVFLHGGPWFGLQVGSVGDSDFWTSRGVALLQSDYAGSGILGEEAMWEPLRAVGMPECDREADGVLDGVRKLIDTGVADPARTFLYGFSSGGYLVNRIVTRPHPFAGAACWDGPADPRAFAGTTRDIQNFFRGCTREECPERWDGASPITRPEAVTVDFTIISAGLSNLATDAAAWYSALLESGARVTLSVYENEDHVFRPDAHSRVLGQLAVEWGIEAN